MMKFAFSADDELTREALRKITANMEELRNNSRRNGAAPEKPNELPPTPGPPERTP